MTPSDLRERVARAMYDAYVRHHPNGVFAGMSWEDLDSKVQSSFYVEADAAIAIVLEEAAKAGDELGCECEGCGHLCGDPMIDMEIIRKAGGVSCCPERKMRPIGSAIRALKETP